MVRVSEGPSHVTVRVDAAVGCARCAAGRGCGAGLSGSAGKSLELELPVTEAAAGLQVGDHVQVNLASGNLLNAALIAYGIPLVGAAIAAAIAYLLQASEPVSVAASLAGLAAGMVVSIYRIRRPACLGNLTPRVESDAGARH